MIELLHLVHRVRCFVDSGHDGKPGPLLSAFELDRGGFLLCIDDFRARIDGYPHLCRIEFIVTLHFDSADRGLYPDDLSAGGGLLLDPQPSQPLAAGLQLHKGSNTKRQQDQNEEPPEDTASTA